MIIKKKLSESVKIPAGYDLLQNDWYTGSKIDYDNSDNYNLSRDFKTSDNRFDVSVSIIPSGADDNKAGGVIFFGNSHSDKAISIDSYRAFDTPMDAAKYLNRIAEELADLTPYDILKIVADKVMKNCKINPNDFGITEI